MRHALEELPQSVRSRLIQFLDVVVVGRLPEAHQMLVLLFSREVGRELGFAHGQPFDRSAVEVVQESLDDSGGVLDGYSLFFAFLFFR